MSKDRHEQVGALFLQVRELPAKDRAGFLDEACTNDAALRAEVESLLEGEAVAPNLTAVLHVLTDGQGDGNINGPPSAPRDTIDTPAASMPAGRPDQVGPYKILEQIGEGGMGTVYVAEQTAPIRRRVALKIIKLGMDTRQVIARFEAERQALAMMNHPNIARALDAGATETGRPFFVMELVRGIPITDHCDQERLDTRSRLELFTHVCEAIQHAHQKGIVHRDIKPSNVMVTLQDGVPVPKVIDFGVAKATNAELTQKTLFTEHHQLIGTPEYMSPEQADMGGLDIDTRSDIYSLGVLLYVLLTGTTPFSSKELRQAGFSDLQYIIRKQEPRKPSTRLAELPSNSEATAGSPEAAADTRSLLTTTIDEIAHQRRVNPHTLRKQLRGDLDWIVLKALEKDRSRRYETANGLAADLRRHLNDEPVLASPPRAGYRLRKFVRRNRTGVVVAGLIAITLIVGIVGTTIGFVRANRASEVAAANAAQAQQVAAFLEEVTSRNILRLVEIYCQQGKTDEAEAMLARSLEEHRRVLGDEHIDTIASIDRLALLYGRLGRFDEAIALWAQGLEIRKRVLGEQHTLYNMDRIAELYKKSGRLEEAIVLLTQALEIRQRDHIDTRWNLEQLVRVYLQQGRTDETEALITDVLGATWREPDDDADALRFLASLGGVYSDRGYFEEAEPLLGRAFEGMQSVLGKEHQDTLWTMDWLAYNYRRSGRLEEAESILRESLALHERVLGKTHRQTVITRFNLIQTLRAQDEVDEAGPLTRVNLDALLEFAQRPDADANMLNRAASELLYAKPQSLRDPQMALGLAIRADELTHHRSPSNLDTLALAYQLTGDRSKAIETWTQALELLRKGHKDRAEIADRLSECQRALEGVAPPP